MVKTAPYPDNDRREWVREYLLNPTVMDGMLQFAYKVYPNRRSRDRGDSPFLLNSHKAMVRETHQRIVTRPSGAMVHVSGAEVLPEDVEAFLENDRAAYRWLTMNDAEWEDDRGRKLAPWMFPTYWGVPEGLDPQWQRETFILPQARQVAELLAGYDVGVMARRLSGDHRGTTLDLQVGADADSGHRRLVDATTKSFATNACTTGNQNIAGSDYQYDSFSRYGIVNVAPGDTIDVCYETYTANGEQSQTQVDWGIKFEDSANPATPTTWDDYDGRTKTAAVTFINIGTWVNNTEYNSPSLVTPCQTAIDATSRSSGDALNIFTIETSSPADTGEFEDRRRWPYVASSAKAAKLHIEYTAAGGSLLLSNPNQRNQLLRL